jgi:hypothetical protein
LAPIVPIADAMTLAAAPDRFQEPFLGQS